MVRIKSMHEGFFQTGFLLDLYSGALIFERSDFQMKIENKISHRVKSYYSYKVPLLHELRVKNFFYLAKDKQNVKGLHYSLH